MALDSTVPARSGATLAEPSGPALPPSPRVAKHRAGFPWRWLTVALAIACVVLLLVESSVPDPSRLGPVTLQTDSSSSSGTTPLDYPYAVSPSLYPSPSNLTSTSPTSLVQLVTLPSSTTSYGMLNASGNSSSRLWFSVGTYSPTFAEAIERDWSCVQSSLDQTGGTGTCIPTPTVPIAWATASIASFSSPVTADALASQWPALYAAATVSGTTHLYLSSNGGATWSSFAASLSGTVVGMVATPVSETILTQSGTHLTSSVFDTSGGEIGATALSPSASSITGVSLAVAAEGASWRYVVAVGAEDPNEIEVASSADGVHYSSFTDVASVNVTVPNAALSSIGDTRLYPPGGTPGQVAVTADSVVGRAGPLALGPPLGSVDRWGTPTLRRLGRD